VERRAERNTYYRTYMKARADRRRDDPAVVKNPLTSEEKKELIREKKRQAYHAKKAREQAAGVIPRPRGRPRKTTT
jgi:hypothetical protein